MTELIKWYNNKFSPAKENWMCFDTTIEAVNKAYYIAAFTELDCWLRDYIAGVEAGAITCDGKFASKLQAVTPDEFIREFFDWFDDCEGTYQIFADNDARPEAFMSFVSSFTNN